MADGGMGGAARAQTYWALGTPKALASELRKKIDGYHSWLRQTNRAETWRRAMALTYGHDIDRPGVYSTQLTLGGTEGELVQGRCNLFRSFVRSIHNTITGSKVAYKCRAMAQDSRATEAVRLGDALVDHHQSRGGGDDACVQSVWLSLIFAESHVAVTWDEDAGSELAIGDDGRIVKDGDIRFRAIAPYDIVRDPFDDREQWDWVAIRVTRSRWSLMRRFPEWADKIKAAPNAKRWSGLFDGSTAANTNTEDARGSDDLVDTWEFYHRPTDAIPAGRESVYVPGVDAVIADGPNRYRGIPLFRMAPLKEPGSSQFFGESWDLIALQQAFDTIFTQLLSNQENYGLINLFVGEDADWDAEIIDGGARVWKGTVPPQPLLFNANAAEAAIGVLDFIQRLAQLVSGQNDVAMGDASKSQSGQALAMLSQLAVQSVSFHQRQYAAMHQGVGTAILEYTRLFAKADRIIQIAGDLQGPIAQRFKVEQLEVLQGVTVDLGAPQLRTSQGREAVADKLVAMGAITNQRDYLRMLSSASTDDVLDAALSAKTLVQQENAMLLRGEPVVGVETDNHAEHIRDHTITLNDPILRQNGEALASALAHIQWHAQTWLKLSMPGNVAGMSLLTATGQQPHPAAAMIAAQQAAATAAGAMPAPGGPAGPTPPEPPQGGPGGPPMPQGGAAQQGAPPGAPGPAPNLPPLPADAPMAA